MNEEQIIKKYSNIKTSYYTSFPVLQKWGNITENEYKQYLSKAQKDGKFDFSLYIHFPFCSKLCYYCFCQNYITQDYNKIKIFIGYLLKEIDLLHDFLKKNNITPILKEIHLGGGSPSFMKIEEIKLVINKLKDTFTFNYLDEFNLEIDIRTVDKQKLREYASMGINRVSFGIQEFDPIVQRSINRIQPYESVKDMLTKDIKDLFKSINFDLIYGLPNQTDKIFEDTINKTKNLSPDRICIYNYDHRPEIYKHQSLMKNESILNEYEKTKIFINAINKLTEYELIGIDHFAKKTDDLYEAKIKKKLGRNFNGYHRGITNNLIGLGPSCLSAFDKYYVQSIISLNEYYKAIDNGNFPVLKGYSLNNKELIIREIIFTLICVNKLKFEDIEKKFNLNFNEYFKKELKMLEKYEKEGLINITKEDISFTKIGRFFIRHICKVFDNQDERI